MAVRLRLARHGRKGRPFYYIVAADSRSPRDGRFIERIGSYNPMTNPASIDLNFDSALKWINNGAQPSDTVRSILSYKGVLMKKHLLDGVKKGAFDEAEAEKRFKTWLDAKNAKIRDKISNLAAEKRSSDKARLEAETELNKKKAEAIAKKQLAAFEALQEKVEETTDEAQTEETAIESAE